MSGAAGLDLRLPIGALFSLLGIVVAGYGAATAGDAERYARSEAININLWWGLVMLVFGLALLLLARRSSRATVRPAERSAEGRVTEELEHERGFER